MPLEHALSDSTARAAAAIRMGLVIGWLLGLLCDSGARAPRAGGPLLRLSGLLFLVQVAIGLRGHVELQLVALGLVRLRDLDVVQRHDARQRRDAADESADRMEAAGETPLDRQLGVETLHVLA